MATTITKTNKVCNKISDTALEVIFDRTTVIEETDKTTTVLEIGVREVIKNKDFLLLQEPEIKAQHAQNRANINADTDAKLARDAEQEADEVAIVREQLVDIARYGIKTEAEVQAEAVSEAPAVEGEIMP